MNDVVKIVRRFRSLFLNIVFISAIVREIHKNAISSAIHMLNVNGSSGKSHKLKNLQKKLHIYLSMVHIHILVKIPWLRTDACYTTSTHWGGKFKKMKFMLPSFKRVTFSRKKTLKLELMKDIWKTMCSHLCCSIKYKIVTVFFITVQFYLQK